MPIFELEPDEGPHAAAKLTDAELDFLQQVVAVELAIRLDRKAYEDRFRSIADHRAEMDDMVHDWRNQRDRIIFVTSVRADLDQLPVLEER